MNQINSGGAPVTPTPTPTPRPVLTPEEQVAESDLPPQDDEAI